MNWTTPEFYEERIARLAETFPTLEKAPLRPWDAQRFDQWACRQPSSGLCHAARFVLAVWAANVKWRIGKFDVIEAFGAWDKFHREAFVKWCSAPWWH